MPKYFYNEEFKEIDLDKSLTLRYAISNYGRLVSFVDDINEGRILKGGTVDGYRIIRYRIKEGGKTLYKHKLLYKYVAENFLTKTSDEQLFVLHLDRIRNNDHVNNLRWATKEEMLQHHKESPYVIEAKRKLIETHKNADGKKLTTIKVILLKKLFANPNKKPRIKMIAKQFGVSEMTLYRIKSGENWGHIKI